MRIVFLGTPSFAVPILDALLAAGQEIAGVVSQPDREKDRKGNLLPTPVKAFALERGLPILQCERVSNETEKLRIWRPDVMITAAFGQLLSPEVLAVPRYGVLNVHASLLPKYRGASPVQAAILAGEQTTGVTIMQTDPGMDTGDILSTVTVPVTANDTARSLSEKLSVEGARLLCQTLVRLQAGTLTPRKQDNEKATYCRKIEKSDAKIDWNKSAEEIARAVRAFVPKPIAYTFFRGGRLQITAATPVPSCGGRAGTLCVEGDTVTVACGEGGLRLLTVQPAGKKQMQIDEYLRGHKICTGEECTNE